MIIVEEALDITIDGIVAKYPSHQTDMTRNWQDQHYSWTGIVVTETCILDILRRKSFQNNFLILPVQRKSSHDSFFRNDASNCTLHF